MSLKFHTKFVCLSFTGVLISTLCGCSLMVMAGKSLLGDPLVDAAFSRAANVDLTTGEHRVVVLASTPETIKGEFPATNVDLIEQVTRNLKAHGVNVVNSNKVASWLDDNGGYWDHVNELANDFDCEYIIHLEIDTLTLQEPRSPDMYQGHVSGTVHGYEIRESRQEKVAHRILNKSFDRKYPDGYPQLADRMSRESFHRELMDHISLVLSQQLYNHHSSDEIY